MHCCDYYSMELSSTSKALPQHFHGNSMELPSHKKVLLLLSALLERFSVSRMQDVFHVKLACLLHKNQTMTHRSWWLCSPGITGPTNPLSNTLCCVARHRKYTKHITLLTLHKSHDKSYKTHTTCYTQKNIINSCNATPHTQDTKIYTLQNTNFSLNTSYFSITLPVHTTKTYYWELMG